MGLFCFHEDSYKFIRNKQIYLMYLWMVLSAYRLIQLSIFDDTGLSIGLATMIVFIGLYCWRINSYGVKNISRTNYQGISRNTTIPEGGAVYFGIPVFSYEELKEATNNFDQARELGEGGFGTIYYGKGVLKPFCPRRIRPVFHEIYVSRTNLFLSCMFCNCCLCKVLNRS